MVDKSLVDYIEKSIITQYENFDKGHGVEHVNAVVTNSLEIAKEFEVDINMIYVIAAYHDIGMKYDRKTHHLTSAEELLGDKRLLKWFNLEQLEIMAEAVRQHRASNEECPNTIYGIIISEADREIDYQIILRRTVQYSCGRFPQYTKEEHRIRCIDHIKEKYGKGGYLKLWLNTTLNESRLNTLQECIMNEQQLNKDFEKIYNEEQKDL